MKKKLLIAVLATTAAIFGAFGFAACGEDEHVHVPSVNWKNDNEHHWRVCTKCADVIGKKEPHKDSDKDDKCDECGYNVQKVETTDEFTFRLTKGEYQVEGIGKLRELENVVIPAEYNGIPVTSIRYDAFYLHDEITSVTIPHSITSIGKHAFSSCKNLSSVTISEGVTTIEAEAFYRCKSLIEITIPASVTVIEENAFNESRRQLIIYCEAESKPAGWDDDWNASTNIEPFPVVWNCKENDIADNGYVYTVSDGVRYAMKGKTAIVDVFHRGKLQNEVTILKTVTHNGTEYTVTEIGKRAFEDCYNLTGITIPDSVTSIGNSAFRACYELASVTIPNSVTLIGNSAFSTCMKLTDINYGDTKYRWELIKKESVWDEVTGNYTIHCTDGDIEKS